MKSRGMVTLVVALSVVVVPVGLLVWLRTETADRLSGLEPEPVAVVVLAESREVSDTRAVTVVPVWGAAPEVLAPSWFGTVTSVAVEPGDVVVSGDAVMKVDGVVRAAAATPEPFWRPLGRRDRGSDVEALQGWLAEVGTYEGDIDGVYGRDTETAMKEWAASLGVAKPDGSFDPSWVLWLPGKRFSVSSVEATVGAPAPATGSPVLVGAVPLVSVELRDQDSRRFVETGEWVLQVGDVEAPVVDGKVTDAGLEMLAEALDQAGEFASGRVQRAEPVKVLEIPATAVVANASGDTCVFVPAGDGFEPRPVMVGGGQLSRVDIAEGLEARDEVLVNPQDLFDAPTCS